MSTTESQRAAMDEVPIDQLLTEHKWNPGAAEGHLGRRIKLPLFPALGWVEPQFVFWKIHVRDHGHVAVWVGKDNLPVLLPLLSGLFGDAILGKWAWDAEAWKLHRRRS